MFLTIQNVLKVWIISPSNLSFDLSSIFDVFNGWKLKTFKRSLLQGKMRFKMLHINQKVNQKSKACEWSTSLSNLKDIKKNKII